MNDKLKDLKAEAYDLIAQLELTQIKLKEVNEKILQEMKIENAASRPTGQ